MTNEKDLSRIVTDNLGEVTREWVVKLKADGTLQTGRIKESELETECRRFLELAASEMFKPGDSAQLGPIHDMLGSLSRSRALQGFTPSETSNFVLAVKLPLFELIGRQLGPAEQAQTMMALTAFIDRLALFTIETFQRSREEVIIRQQREIAELSTPVVRLWGGILALPLIGTLDSERTQVVMENLLQSIVEYSAEIAIIDITGVPTVDTLVAQHLLKTVAAARLMGADCLISGIRPQIAQTMVHLGVELNVVSKASLADALALAFQRVGLRVISTAPEPRAGLA
ncbi:STAS domain-containing protein [Alsobacter sp. SYSU M60028]|uniref:STAS domain-containing protein n=1 Tax=Alsobacter ponti TaxID=2962936 RepID=A0ABT1L7R3_9HYPH|nr:STAS domain-containing protein [Alsobacter ponti]MCP8937530.1 STAS domain-containing protein [Alsobacter ponti]